MDPHDYPEGKYQDDDEESEEEEMEPPTPEPVEKNTGPRQRIKPLTVPIERIQTFNQAEKRRSCLRNEGQRCQEETPGRVSKASC